MRQLPQIQSGEDQSGCTSIIALVTETHVICANSGDSRGIFFADNKTKAMSYDHKPFNVSKTSIFAKLMLCDQSSGHRAVPYRKCRWLCVYAPCQRRFGGEYSTFRTHLDKPFLLDDTSRSLPGVTSSWRLQLQATLRPPCRTTTGTVLPGI